MKIKTKEMPFDKVIFLDKRTHFKPKKPSKLLKLLIRILSRKELKQVNIKINEYNMDKITRKQPCIILMNHSCFLDLKIAFKYFKRKRFNIVSAADGFVGKKGLMRAIGCFPTDKYVSDITLVQDIKYCLTKNKTSVLIYPEAAYSLDGTSGIVPKSVGKLIKLFGVPLITVITKGAYLHDPLYNNLQLRSVPVEIDVKCALTKEDIKQKSASEINEIITKEFTFDNFLYQRENGIKIIEPFRAEGLHRVLYKCPHCLAEEMTSAGNELTCKNCGAIYSLTEEGELKNQNGESVFSHVPSWFDWQRNEIRKELLSPDYKVEIPVKIAVLSDYKKIYLIGEGTLTHDKTAFKLKGAGVEFIKPAISSATLYIDYFWYEMGDIISVGDTNYTYYCFPKNDYPVTKAKLATEELYKILNEK